MIIRSCLKGGLLRRLAAMKSRKDKEPSTKVVEKKFVSSVPKSIYERDGHIYLVINAKPNSKVSQLQEITEEGIGVNVAAPPREGEANEELLSFIGEVLALKKSSIDLDRGGKSRSKLVVLSDSGYTVEEVYSVLQEHLKP